MTKSIKSKNAARKRKQREMIRAWVIQQTGGKITTAEGYVMALMKGEQS